MLASVKSEIRKAIRSLGFDVYRFDKGQLAGHYLQHDLPELLKGDSPTVVDIGANEGQRIQLVRRAFRSPRITSFEPNPELARFLRATYGDVATIVEAAVGAAEAELDFHIYANDRLSSLRDLEGGQHFGAEETQLKSTIKVPVVTLGEYWQKHGAGAKIDLLFIDAQGFDREVLEGAEELLASGLVGTIIMDLYCAHYYAGQDNSFWDVQPWLGSKGYGLVGLYEIVRRGAVISAAAGCFQQIRASAEKTSPRQVEQAAAA